MKLNTSGIFGVSKELFNFWTLSSHKVSRNHPSQIIVIDQNCFQFSDAEVVLVFDYMPNDLSGLIRSIRPQRLSMRIIKSYMKQLLEAVAEIHDRDLMHLDIKPANILLNERGQLFLGDLGLMTSAGGKQSNNVVTRWYKPPELLLGDTEYGPEVDMWGVGCVFFELLMGTSPFPGRDEADQFRRIVQLCGSEFLLDVGRFPSHPSRFPQLPLYSAYTHNLERTSSQLYARVSNFPPEAADLLARLLCVNPTQRITASDAYDHDFFFTGVDPADEDELISYPFSIHEFELRKSLSVGVEAVLGH